MTDTIQTPAQTEADTQPAPAEETPKARRTRTPAPVVILRQDALADGTEAAVMVKSPAFTETEAAKTWLRKESELPDGKYVVVRLLARCELGTQTVTRRVIG